MSLLGDIGGAVFGGNMMGLSTAASVGGNLLAYHGAENAIDAQMQQVARNEALQREFAQQGVRWRVEDAKAAGVHPLFALGGSGASFSPSALVGGNPNEHLGRGLSEMGQNLQRAVAAQETPDQRLQRELALEAQLAGITKDYAQASYWQSMAAQTRQANRASAGMPGIVTQPFRRGTIEEKKLLDIIDPNPSKQTSARSEDMSVEAARNPLHQEWTITPYGLKMRLPKSDEPMESWGELSWYDKLGLIAHNLGYYGTDWGGRFLREYLRDQAPVWTVAPRSMERSFSPEREVIRKHARRFSQW